MKELEQKWLGITLLIFLFLVIILVVLIFTGGIIGVITFQTILLFIVLALVIKNYLKIKER